MIATTPASKTGYTELVQQLIGDTATPVTPAECLILTHNNPVLLSRLDEAIGDRLTILLDVPQHQWCLGHGDLQDSLVWAIQEAGIKHLMLVGDSSAGPKIQTTENMASSRRNTDPLSHARAANACRKTAQDHFREQLNQFWECPRVGEAARSRNVQITGLFFRAEAGAFSIYDKETDSFALLD